MAAYTKTAWVNGGAPAISAANLNKIELGLENAVGLDVLADLRALPVPTTVFTARTLGFSSAGDGGGGIFWWDSSSSAADNGGTIIVPNSSPATGRWMRLFSGRVSVLWFGADKSGSTNSASAFSSTFAVADDIYAPEGTYNIAGLSASGTLSNPKRIVGDGWGKTILTGDGDLITTDGHLNLSNLYIKNITTEGRLIRVSSGSAVNESIFDNVRFGKSTYHIYSDRLLVAWKFLHCRFREASVISRYFPMSIWASEESGCYIWKNAVGFRAHGGATFDSYGTVYEQNTGRAVELISDDATREIINWNFHGTHFENNAATSVGHVLIETKTASASNATVINFVGVSFFNSPAKTAFNVELVKTTGGINRLNFDGIYSTGKLVTNLNSAIISTNNVRYTSGSAELNHQEQNSFVFSGVVAGNDAEQLTRSLSVGETHLVTYSTISTGTGTGGAYGQFMITKLPDGTVLSTILFDERKSGSIYGCVIDITAPSSGDYAVDNASGMSSTFQPRIVVQRI